MAKPWEAAEAWTGTLILSFWDLRGYTKFAQSTSSQALFEMFAAYFDACGKLTTEGGGRLVKCIGDAGFAVFAPDDADRAIATLVKVHAFSDAQMRAHGCETVVKVHVGEVTTGNVGGSWDAYGYAVNQTARLADRGFVISGEVQKLLSADLQQRFRYERQTGRYFFIP